MIDHQPQKMKSREEIRFLTLLTKTQDKASQLKSIDNDHVNEAEFDNWRLPKVNRYFQGCLNAILFC